MAILLAKVRHTMMKRWPMLEPKFIMGNAKYPLLSALFYQGGAGENREGD